MQAVVKVSRQDDVRDVKRCEFEVTIRPRTLVLFGQVVNGGHYDHGHNNGRDRKTGEQRPMGRWVDPAPQKVVVYEDQVDLLRAMVETDEDRAAIAEIKVDLDVRLAEHLAGGGVAATFGETAEAEFERRKRRPLKPILAIKELRSGIPSPVQEQRAAQGNTDTIAELAAQIAAQMKRVPAATKH